MRNGHYCRQVTPFSAYGSGDEADRIGDGRPVSNVAPFSVYAWLRSSPTAEACDIAGQRGARIHAVDIGRDTQPHGRAAIALLEKCADRGYGGNPAVDEVHAMRSARKLKDAVEDIIPIRRTLRFVDCSPDTLRNATSTTEHRLASIEVRMAAALSELEVLLMPDDKAAYENRRATRQSGFPEGISTNCDRTRVAAGCTGQRRSASRKTRQWNATARGDPRRRAGSRREASKYGSDSRPANEMKHGRSPTRWLKVFRGRVAWPGVRIASRASGRAWRLGKGTAWVLALLAGIGHAEERSHESGASGVFYVSATVVSDDTGGLGESGAAVAFANVDCGWEDPPPGATVGCVSPVAEGARLRIAVRHVNAEGEPVAAETDLEFRYRTTPISATADEDYLSVSRTLTIKAGEFVSSPATLTTLDDVLDEFQELFAVELESDHEFPVDLEFDYVVIPINDNDPEVRVSLDGEDAAEDAGILSFEVSLSGTSGKKVTVDFATSDGTAVAEADYRPAEGTLTFEPGEVAKTVEVSVIDDAIHEPAEWFELALTNARNARLPRAPARGTIRDDDALLTIAGASAGEGSGGLEFVVTATGLAAGGAPVTVDYATQDGTATAGADYEPVSGTLTFTAERAEQVVAVPLVDDAVDEPEETLTVVLTNVANATIGTAAAVGVIEDDDPVPELRISGGSAAEGESIGFVVTLSGSSERTVTVDFATSDGTAVAEADYRPAEGTLTFEPGEVAKTVEVGVIDDAIHEPAEWFELALTNARNARLPRAPARGTIRDDDALLTIAGASAGEGSGGLEFVVTATGLAAGGAPVTVDYATQDGTATAGADYEPVSGTLTFTAERAEQVVAVPLVDDAVDEPEETLTVVLTNVANATIGTAAAVGVIEDDDPAPELEISGGAASEGETMEFAVTLSGSTARTVTVDFATSDGTAVAEADYRPAAGTLTFEPGEIARTVEVSVIDDAVHEPAEWFELALSNARNARLPRFPARGTIQDDDAFLTIAGASAGEGSGGLEFVVTATGLAAGGAPVTVDYATEDGTATAGADYEPVSGTLTFTAERAEQVVAVPLVDDAVDEPEETLTVVLTNVANATIGTAAAVGVIEDDDPVPELEISGGAASEGETMEFAVTLSGSTARTVTVDFATSDGTAVAEADYRPAAGTLTFEPGEVAKTVEVGVIDDAIHEPAEWFELALTNARNARLPRAPARGTIRDDDALLTIAGASAGEGSGGLEFVVTATGLAAGGAPVTVDYATQDGTATAGADYEPVSGTLTFTAERAEQVVAVPLIDDAVDEPEETLTVVLTNVANAMIVTAAAVGVIEDDDPVPELEISGGAASEGETMEFAVTLSGSTARTVTVDFATSDGTAVAEADYRPAAGTLTFEPGEIARTVEVSVVDDAVHEPAEWFELALSNARNARLPRFPARGTIRDDDAFLTIAGASAGEASDRLEFVVTATGLAAGDAPVTVDYATQDGTATAGADYEPVSGTLTFTAERAEQVVAVPLIDDAVDEPEETLTVVLTNVANATIGTAAAVGVIEDDDPAPELEISGGAASEGETMEFAVTLSGSTARTVTVDFATSDGTAVAEADYRPAAGTLTFEPGEIARTVEVSVIDDAVHEPAEWFALALANARNARLPRAPARGTIRDDDAFLTIAGAGAGEGSGGLEFVVTATGLAAGGAPVTVDYATEDGTATAGADYEPVSGTLTFTAQRAEQVVAVPLVDDAVDEPEETLTVVLTNVANAMIGTAAAVGVIEDDDPVPELEIGGGAASEGETMGFAVTLSGLTARTVTVDYATADGSATAGADYGSVSGTLTFAPGESSATVSVDIVDDEMYEPDETFVARLSSPVNAVIATGEATGTILDDDEEPAAVAVLPENPMLCVGGAPARIDLSRHFSGTALSYAVSAPDPSVATASLGGAVLVLTPVAEGETSVTVTAANMGSRATLELTITVVADPAELAAIERGLAVAGGVFLADVMDAIGDRFVDAGASDRGSNAPPPASALVDRSAADVFAAEWVANPGGFAAREAPEEWPPVRPLDSMRLGSGSLSFSATPRSGIGNWSVWGRGGTRRFGDGEMLKDGSLTALQVGADARVGEWLVGAAAGLARTEADYGFVRSADACGGGEGEGVLETEIASVHPYLGRRVGRGWIWGTAGVGGGEAVVERCASGHRTAADLSMRMGALGGRHVIRGSQRVEVSLVEDVGVLRAKTEAAIGPAGNHDVSVGRARLGVEVRGVCATGAGIVGWVRAFARRDWGDGIEGSGAEVALGARLDAPETRLRLDAVIHAVAAHTEDDYKERGANVTAAYLSRPDGTGLQVSMALRRGAPGEASRLGESWWLSSGPRDARRGMRGDVSVGFGFRAPRGLARPFAAVGKSDQGRIVAAGLRYEALPGPSQFVGEFSIGHRRGGGFVMARFEARR